MNTRTNVVTIFLLTLIGLNQMCFGEGINPDRQPDSWKFSCQRDEIAPLYFIDDQVRFNDQPTLALSGGGKEYSIGYWYSNMEVIANGYYQFSVYYKYQKVEEPERCILANIIWLNKEGQQVNQTEYPAMKREKTPDGWSKLEQIYLVPEDVVNARIELIYRWDGDGIAHFGGVTMEKTTNPGSRTVKIATIHHRPSNSSSSRENLEQFARFINDAADRDADIVCLPESITLIGTRLDYVSASEPIPGPTTQYFGKIAAQHGIYIVAGILEKDDPVTYCTAILIDRKGNLIGKYRKTSIPREESVGGVTPGQSLPVFDTDFGTIGIMICIDVMYPEQARTLARKGAEIIFLPIWGGNVTLTKARAIENQVYLVSSTYDMISAVFDLEGEILDEATNEKPVVVVEVDLNERKVWPWLGEYKNRIPRGMPTRKALEIE